MARIIGWIAAVGALFAAAYAILIIAVLPMIREDARRAAVEGHVRVETGPDIARIHEADSTGCDAALPPEARSMQPFFEGRQKDGTISIFRVDPSSRTTWRYDCRRVGDAMSIVSATVIPANQ